MKKKIISVLIIGVMLVGLSACSNKTDINDNSNNQEETTTETENQKETEKETQETEKETEKETEPQTEPQKEAKPETKADEPKQTSNSEQTEGNDTLKVDDYIITIKDYKLANIKDDRNALIINIDYTNNGSDGKSFLDVFNRKAFQSGIEIDGVYFSFGDGTFETKNSSREIKNGATLPVQIAFELMDRTSPVEVEINKSYDDNKITKIFDIANLS